MAGMMFVAERSLLLNRLRRVYVPPEKKDTSELNPFEGYVLIRAKTSHVSLSGHDYAFDVTTRLEVAPTAEGSLCVRGNRIIEALRLLPEGSVSVTQDRDTLRLETKGVVLEIVGRAAADYPSVFEPPSGGLLLPFSKVWSLLRRTYYAAYVEPNHPSLGDIVLQGKKRELKAVTSDGPQLAVAILSLAEDISLDIMVSRRAASWIVSFPHDEGAQVRIVDSDRIFFVLSDTVIMAKKTSRVFPPCPMKPAVPWRSSALLPRARMEFALKAARLSISEDLVIMEFRATEVVLSSNLKDRGSARVEIETILEGEPAVIEVRDEYLASALEAIETDDVRVAYSEKTGRLVLLPPDSTGSFSLMPANRVKNSQIS